MKERIIKRSKAFFIFAIVLSLLSFFCTGFSLAGDLRVLNFNSYPTRICLGPGGRIYVSDAKLGSVFIYDTNQKVLGELKNLASPLGVAVDVQGNIYVGNNGRDNVEVYSSAGDRLREIDNGGIKMPNDLVLDKDTNIYVVDSLSDTVKVYSSDGRFLRGIGSSGDGEGGLKFPVSLAILYQGAGELHVADQGHKKIQVYSLQGQFLRSYGEVLTNEAEWQGRFMKLQSIEADGRGRIHALDIYQHKVQIFNAATGQYIDSYGAFGINAGQLNVPLDILVNDIAEVLVTNSGNQKVEAVYRMDYAGISCSAEKDCPYLFSCSEGTCVIAQAVDVPTTTTSISGQPLDVTPTTTTTTGDGGACPFEQILGADDQHRLHSVREFRDKRLAGASSELVSLYYKHAKEITNILSDNPYLQTQFKQTAVELLPSLSAGLGAKGAIVLTQTQYRQVITVLMGVNSKASASLRRSISQLLTELKSGSLLKNVQVEIQDN
ncbi:MAG: 6-bladed beta-propeller [Pseudomonadota bacterium]